MLQLLNHKETTEYGFKLTSPFDIGLYASAFLFNMSDFGIRESFFPFSPSLLTRILCKEQVYAPGYAKSGPGLDVSIPAKGSMTFGYGSDLVEHIGFELTQFGRTVDVAFLKVFLSSEPVHLGHIPQRSPFDGVKGAVARPRKKRPVWDSVLIPIVQKKV